MQSMQQNTQPQNGAQCAWPDASDQVSQVLQDVIESRNRKMAMLLNKNQTPILPRQHKLLAAKKCQSQREQNLFVSEELQEGCSATSSGKCTTEQSVSHFMAVQALGTGGNSSGSSMQSRGKRGNMTTTTFGSQKSVQTQESGKENIPQQILQTANFNNSLHTPKSTASAVKCSANLLDRENLKKLYSKLKEEYRELYKRHETTHYEKISLEEKYAVCIQKFNASEREHSGVLRQLRKAEAENENAQAQNEAYAQVIEELREEHFHAAQARESSSLEIENLRSENFRLRQEVEMARRHTEQREEEEQEHARSDEMKKLLVEADSKLAELCRQNEAMNAENNYLREQHTQISEALQKSTSRVQDLQNITQKAEFLEQLQHEIEGELRNKSEQLAKAHAQYEDCKRHSEEVEKKLQRRFDEELRAAHQDAERARQDNAVLMMELQILRRQLQEKDGLCSVASSSNNSNASNYQQMQQQSAARFRERFQPQIVPSKTQKLQEQAKEFFATRRILAQSPDELDQELPIRRQQILPEHKRQDFVHHKASSPQLHSGNEFYRSERLSASPLCKGVQEAATTLQHARSAFDCTEGQNFTSSGNNRKII